MRVRPSVYGTCESRVHPGTVERRFATYRRSGEEMGKHEKPEPQTGEGHEPAAPPDSGRPGRHRKPEILPLRTDALTRHGPNYGGGPAGSNLRSIQLQITSTT